MKYRGRNGDRNISTLTRASFNASHESNKDENEKIAENERNGDGCVLRVESASATTMRCIIENRGFMYQR